MMSIGSLVGLRSYMILGLFEDDNEGFLGNQQVFMIGLTQNDQKNFISYYSFLFFGPCPLFVMEVASSTLSEKLTSS